MVECLTDNRNRAAAEVRTAITRNGGNPADPGSVAYLFGRKGVVLVEKATADGAAVTEDDVTLAVLEAGAEDVTDLGEAFEVVSDATDTHAVRLACTDAGLPVESADIAWMPSVSVPLEEDDARKVLAGRGARGPRRRAERLGQLRHQRRGPRVGLTRRASRARPAGRPTLPNTCSDGGLRCACSASTPGLTRCGLGVVEGGPAGRRARGGRRRPHPGRRRPRRPAGGARGRVRAVARPHRPTPSPSSGCSRRPTSAP
jgi:hypothetical protein